MFSLLFSAGYLNSGHSPILNHNSENFETRTNNTEIAWDSFQTIQEFSKIPGRNSNGMEVADKNFKDLADYFQVCGRNGTLYLTHLNIIELIGITIPR